MVLPPETHTCPERIANNFGALTCQFEAGHKDGPNPRGHYYVSAAVPQVASTEAVES